MARNNNKKLTNSYDNIIRLYSKNNNDSQDTKKKYLVLFKEINYSFSPCGKIDPRLWHLIP
jgi:hypothetical protein